MHVREYPATATENRYDVSITETKLTSCGVELDVRPQHFGWLRESSDVADRPSAPRREL